MAAVTVSLEWLLAQDDLGLRLVAGVPAREQLTWAHASDLVDPTPWLTGGELVLTTGIGLPRAVGEQRAYVGRLADAGAAGLGFGVGVRYAAIPAPIVAACSERKFPLLEVPLPTPFIAITQSVARKTSDVAKAIIICLLIGGGIFLVAGHVAQSVFPNVAGFHMTDDTLPEMALKVGGKFFQVLFMSAAFAATVASALALIAFTAVNLSVLAWFAVRRRQFRTVKQVATNIVLPVIGMAMTGLLWSFLHADALISGLVWVSIGIIYAVVLTKVTGKRLTELDMDQTVADQAEEVLAAEPRIATELEQALATDPHPGPRALAGV